MNDPPRDIPQLGQLLALVGRGREAFAKEVGGWVLVGQLPDDVGAEWNYRTGATKTARAVRAATGELEAMLDETWSALVLKKRPNNTFPDTVFVGRATNNDVCLPHASVSKLHARLRYQGKNLMVQDAGSSNGTMVNGEPVQHGVDVAITHGDLIRFGSVVFQCFEPLQLHGVLERFIAAR